MKRIVLFCEVHLKWDGSDFLLETCDKKLHITSSDLFILLTKARSLLDRLLATRVLSISFSFIAPIELLVVELEKKDELLLEIQNILLEEENK